MEPTPRADAPDAAIDAAAPPPRANARPPLLDFAIDAIVAVALLFGISLVCSAAWGAWRGYELARAGVRVDAARIGQPGGAILFGIAMLAVGLAALVVYGRRRASAQERAESARRARQPATWVWAVMVGVATFLFSSITMALAAHAGLRPVPSNVGSFRDIVAHHAWLLWLGTVVLAPAYEELLFRRVLFGRLWAAGRPWLGAILSSALFALLHETPGSSHNGLAAMAVLWLSYGVMGCAFAWVYRHTGTLWAAIGAHGLNNLLGVALISLATSAATP
jgi:membrane protease YdiL (CAAX protease family)